MFSFQNEGKFNILTAKSYVRLEKRRFVIYYKKFVIIYKEVQFYFVLCL